MKFTVEIDCRIDCKEYLFGHALENIEHLTDEELETILESFGSDKHPESIIALNDFFTFDLDEIADYLGYKDWEDLLKREDDDND